MNESLPEPDSQAGVSPVPGMLAVTKPDGEVVLMHEADARAGANDSRLATESEVYRAEHPIAAPLIGGVESRLRGITGGLFDPAVVETARFFGGDAEAEAARKRLAFNREADPISTVNELGGAAAGMLLGGGPMTARTVAGRLALSAGTGAAVGAGMQLSEDALSNHPYAGEALAWSAARGGALGLLMGAGGEILAPRIAGLFGRNAAKETELLATREAVGAAEETAPVLASRLQREAETMRFKGATGATKANVEKLGQERISELSQFLAKEKLTGPTVTVAETSKRIDAKLAEVAARLEPIYTAADAAVTRPQMSAIEDAINAVRESHAGKINAAAELRPMENWWKKTKAVVGPAPSHIELWQARKQTDDILKKSYARNKNNAVPVGEEALHALRDALNTELTASVGRAGKELGSSIGEDLLVANATYRDLSAIDRVIRPAADGPMGLQEASLLAGAVATGNLPAIGLAGVNMASRVARHQYGKQIAAEVLDKANQIPAIRNVVDRFDAALSSGAKGFFSAKNAPRPIKNMTSSDVRAVREAAHSPEVISGRVASALGSLPTAAPSVAQAVAATAARAAQWLTYSLPKDRPLLGLQLTAPKASPMSDTELVKARATIETVRDPAVVLERLRNGRLMAEHVATLRFVYPETYRRIQASLLEHAAEIRPTLTVQQQFSLSMLFGVPMNEAMRPENIIALQASFSQGNQAPRESAPQRVVMRAGPVNGGVSRATGTDQLEAGR